MTDDETIAFGNFCEGLMHSPAFNALHEMFTKQQIDAVFKSAPDSATERERAYTEMCGVQKLLGMMLTLVQQRDQIIQRNDQTELPEADYPEDHPVEGDLGTIPL